MKKILPIAALIFAFGMASQAGYADDNEFKPLPQTPLKDPGFVPAKPFDLHTNNYVISDGTNYCVINKLSFLSFGTMKKKIGADEATHVVEIQAPWPGATYKDAREFLAINNRSGQIIVLKGISPDPKEPEVDVHENDIKDAMKNNDKPIVVVDETGSPAGIVKIIKDTKEDNDSVVAPTGQPVVAGTPPPSTDGTQTVTGGAAPGSDSGTNQSTSGGSAPSPGVIRNIDQ